MASEKILVIDDEEAVCKVMAEELRRGGYEVDSALSGEEAVRMVKKKKYDVIFMDSVMPGMDGVQTCKAIKEIRPEPIAVFFTGVFDEKLSNREANFIASGGRVYYLYKPFAMGELVSVARKALAERLK